jgi:hypothetical protein
MKRAYTLIFLLFCLAAMAAAADVNGAWKGAFEFNGESVPVTLNLKNGGDKVTGNVEGLPTSPAEIHEGKLQEDNITFSVDIVYQGSPVKLVYKGKVSGDQIQFTFGTDDGSWGTDLTVKRAS